MRRLCVSVIVLLGGALGACGQPAGFVSAPVPVAADAQLLSGFTTVEALSGKWTYSSPAFRPESLLQGQERLTMTVEMTRSMSSLFRRCGIRPSRMILELGGDMTFSLRTGFRNVSGVFFLDNDGNLTLCPTDSSGRQTAAVMCRAALTENTLSVMMDSKRLTEWMLSLSEAWDARAVRALAQTTARYPDAEYGFEFVECVSK